MKLVGKVIKLGDNINTDTIISGRYKFQITDIKKLSQHLMEDLDPDFINKITPGSTILVAGENFGMGSSREQAPLVIKEAGVIALIAKNFARIFYRNSFNIGLPLIEADTSAIKDNDQLQLDFDKGVIRNIKTESIINIRPLPAFMQRLIADGGIVNHFKKYGTIKLK
ncbi:MAG: 3-isopropylmalate dehydratase [Candidatus Omnitrophica bacterium]|nr:3-isopropylmalate dehydratase [Candidatus Omnitrophota bacterium]